MQICILDGEKIPDQDALHTLLAASLSFPDWYGRNLDALYDCLTDVQDETEIELRHMELLEKNLGKYAVFLWKVLKNAAGENPRVHIHIR